MIRVLHYIPGFLYGGVESLFLEWYQNIDKSEFHFDLLKRIDDQESLMLEQYKNMGGQVYQLQSLTFKNINGFRKSVKCFFENCKGYDIIHLHGSDPFVMRYAKKNGISKVILHAHTVKRNKGLKPFLNDVDERLGFLLWGDEGWACSESVADWKFKENWKHRKIRIIHNSIKWEKYLYNENMRAQVRVNLGIEKMFVVGTVGRITAPKNPLGILEIFSSVKQHRKNACLLWVGDGPDLKRVKDRINQLGLVESVILTGYREDTAELMQAMDVFILPSLWEGMPLTALEAQAAGMKTLCSENVSTEIDITPWCKHISIDNKERWMTEICSQENRERGNAFKYFRNSKYDLSYGIGELEAGYKQVL